MAFVTSHDGTRIAYQKTGAGPALVLVDGGLCYRASGWTVQLSEKLADRFTVYAYDRRGRGESGNTLPYAPEREYEDLEAVITAAGGRVLLYGHSSGGVIVLDTANRGADVGRAVVYEIPFITDDTRRLMPGYAERMRTLIAAGCNGDTVKHFMRNGVGMPGFVIFIIGLLPFFKTLNDIAPTLAYDTALTEPQQHGEPLSRSRWSHVTAPVKVVGGGKSPLWLRNAQRAIAAVLPDARHAELPGQTHAVKLDAVAATLREFFA